MINIQQSTYEAMASDLFDMIGERSYFEGTIYHEVDEYFAELRLSAIIYRFRESGNIKEIVPIWWELDAITEDGPQMNDFEFKKIRQIIIE